MPDAIQSYCEDYTDYKTHPSRDVLDTVGQHLSVVVDELKKRGYTVDPPRSLNLRRALRCVVTIRNKCAHGALDELFFSHIEADLVSALRMILRLIPFSHFVFWGRFGGNALRFLEHPPKQHSRQCPAYFWAESALLSTGVATRIPFLQYRQDSRTIYLLNDKATEEEPVAEYLDYVTGLVIYRTVEHDWPRPRRQSSKTTTVQEYRGHAHFLLNQALAWREVPLTRAAVAASGSETGVYIFTTIIHLGAALPVQVILYVGKTTNFGERLTSYVRIKKGYDDTRPAIAEMFHTYENSAKLLFAALPEHDLARIERAIYETTMPEFNLIAPPASEFERT